MLNVWTDEYLEIEVIRNEFDVPFLCVRSVEMVFELVCKFQLPTDASKLHEIMRILEI